MQLRWLILCLLCNSCAASLHDHAWLERELRQRTGTSKQVAVGEGAAQTTTRRQPPAFAAARIVDGLSEDEVVELALARNPALRAELTRIDAARATFDEANRPANPQISMLTPIGPVSAVATLLVPLESLWQLPQRAQMAARDADAVGQLVLMNALDAVRDARLLHVELGLAADRAQIRAELSTMSGELARIAAVRARLGDIAPLDAHVFAADAQGVADLAERAETDLEVARARLKNQLALSDVDDSQIRATFEEGLVPIPSRDALTAIARASRPDVNAANSAIAAATERAGWERSRVVALSAQVEHHWGQADPAYRLGGRVDVPIFGANPGGIGRAEAEIVRASALHEVVVRTTVMEIAVAHARALQAVRSLQRFQADILPKLELALDDAAAVFETGDDSYLVVLDVLRRVGETRVRHAEVLAEQRRAVCELERALGARLRAAKDAAAHADAVGGSR